MFTEVEFEEDSFDVAPSAPCRSLVAPPAKKQRIETPHKTIQGRKSTSHTTSTAPKKIGGQKSSNGGGVYVFHKPHDQGFSPVATRAASSQNRKKGGGDDAHDEHFVAGDTWRSGLCHCLSCDSVRAMQYIAKLSQPPTAECVKVAVAPTVVLVDLDNFGYPHFKTFLGADCATRLQERNLFFWCFYGACFERHFGTNPEDFLQQRSTKAKSGQGGQPLALRGDDRQVGQKTKAVQANAAGQAKPELVEGSLWHCLKRTGRVYFTPCGGHNQAADEALMQIVPALLAAEDGTVEEDAQQQHEGGATARGRMRVVLMTCDRHLGETALEHSHQQVSSLNPVSVGRNIGKVWAQLMNPTVAGEKTSAAERTSAKKKQSKRSA